MLEVGLNLGVYVSCGSSVLKMETQKIGTPHYSGGALVSQWKEHPNLALPRASLEVEVPDPCP